MSEPRWENSSGAPSTRATTRHYPQEFDAPRVSVKVTVIAIVLLACALDYVCLVIGISIGRDQERTEQLHRKAGATADSVKPAYGLRQYSCSKEERREYVEACKQRLRSNTTGGF